MNKCLELHKLFNKMKKYDYTTIDNIPFTNGVYIFVGENEIANSKIALNMNDLCVCQ